MNLDDIQVKLNKPYPEIDGAVADEKTVAILKNLANGRLSELGAILQYNFQSVESLQFDKDISKILEEISIVEMMHLEMLMKAITKFGGVATYQNAHGMYFSTQQVNYTLKLKEMLDINIANEKSAIEAYEMAIQNVNNVSLKELFRRIIEDEKRHVEVFSTIRNSINFFSI